MTFSTLITTPSWMKLFTGLFWLGLILSPVVHAGRSVDDVQNDPEWQPYLRWLEQEPRCQGLVKEINAAGMPLLQIVFPTEGSPDFFRSDRLQELLNEFLNYLGIWLDKHNFNEAPDIGGYDKGVLPEQAYDSLMNDITLEDAILIPSLAHLIHIARSDDSPVTEDEKTFFNFRLRWLEEVLLPEGLSIDWGKEYRDVLEDYQKEWRHESVELPTASTLLELGDQAMRESRGSYLTRNLRNKVYKDNLQMKTVWNSYVTLEEGCMDFLRVVDEYPDPLLVQHLKFSLAAGLLGTYEDERNQKLTRFWLRLGELENKTPENSDWLQQVVSYTPPKDIAHKKTKQRLSLSLKKRKMFRAPKQQPAPIQRPEPDSQTIRIQPTPLRIYAPNTTRPEQIPDACLKARKTKVPKLRSAPVDASASEVPVTSVMSAATTAATTAATQQQLQQPLKQSCQQKALKPLPQKNRY